ncbi:MAG: PIN domain-containing protein [Fimbriimonas sp.]|jgi:predicted nucleic acid-binding protein|nr:PIN domain-containing protein [Fimbriimonas sp.]
MELRSVFLDANILIYLIEGISPAAQMAKSFVADCEQRGDALMTSSLAVGEVFVKPLRAGDVDLLRKYESFFQPPQIKVIDFNQECALVFAKLRGIGVKPPDAIHLSCASISNVDVFATNDQRLSKLIVPGILHITSFNQ